jgi:signal transduction histidine kinase
MRRIVGVLRGGEAEESAYAPLPGLADIPELVRSTSDTAELASYGQQPDVSPAIGLTAYRVVQESLTNVLQHAGPAARARVTLAFTADAIEIEVSDDGRGATNPGSGGVPPGMDTAPDGAGHGLQGMRERVTVLGGTLSAQPRRGGGYAVRATLPLSGVRAAA